jgi:hypothetical protein
MTKAEYVPLLGVVDTAGLSPEKRARLERIMQLMDEVGLTRVPPALMEESQKIADGLGPTDAELAEYFDTDPEYPRPPYPRSAAALMWLFGALASTSRDPGATFKRMEELMAELNRWPAL